jgi:hypothetical protein
MRRVSPLLLLPLLSCPRRCDKEFFMDEVGLASVPAGDWYCHGCEKSRSRKRTKAAAPPAAEEKPKRKTRGRG